MKYPSLLVLKNFFDFHPFVFFSMKDDVKNFLVFHPLVLLVKDGVENFFDDPLLELVLLLQYNRIVSGLALLLKIGMKNFFASHPIVLWWLYLFAFLMKWGRKKFFASHPLPLSKCYGY